MPHSTTTGSHSTSRPAPFSMMPLSRMMNHLAGVTFDTTCKGSGMLSMGKM